MFTCVPFFLPAFQSLTIKTSCLAEAENMADLIDGYCRLQRDLDASLIVYPNRGEQLDPEGALWFSCSLGLGLVQDTLNPEL